MLYGQGKGFHFNTFNIFDFNELRKEKKHLREYKMLLFQVFFTCKTVRKRIFRVAHLFYDNLHVNPW